VVHFSSSLQAARLLQKKGRTWEFAVRRRCIAILCSQFQKPG
jgi:hypothetical protein